jgi:hypothetical protein
MSLLIFIFNDLLNIYHLLYQINLIDLNQYFQQNLIFCFHFKYFVIVHY